MNRGDATRPPTTGGTEARLVEAALRCDAEGHCITCSDEALPMRVVALTPGLGVALCEDISGRRTEILIGLLDHVVPGDLVLVHAGAALARAPNQMEATR